MASQRAVLPADGVVGARATAARASSNALNAVERLAGGLGTAVLALVVLVLVAGTLVACLVGIGVLVAPAAITAVHAVADRERARLDRWGPEVPQPGPRPTALRAAMADPTTRRELRWLLGHATLGLLLGIAGIMLALVTLEDLSFPLWWVLLPDGATAGVFGLWSADRWLHAWYVSLTGLVWLALTLALTPYLARWQSRGGLRLLSPDAEADLSMRVAELTATRAAALDAHATELRRIERSLHDSTQNRMVAVTVLLGAARRAMTRDPAGAEDLMDQAQTAAEQALIELRAVARGILPPILADRGLTGALTGLASICPVPCQVDVDVPRRCAASVEATAYFVVSEALTNISRHSGASSAAVVVETRGDRLHVRVTDDGHGGADPERGSGLTGIRRRVDAHDGRLALTSPPGGPTTLEVELPCGS